MQSKPDPGWWQCEYCNADIRPSDANKEYADGGKGNIELLAFCDDCYNE